MSCCSVTNASSICSHFLPLFIPKAAGIASMGPSTPTPPTREPHLSLRKCLHALTPPVTAQYRCSRNTVFALMSELFHLTSQVSHVCNGDSRIRIYPWAASLNTLLILFCLPDLYWVSIILNLFLNLSFLYLPHFLTLSQPESLILNAAQSSDWS